MNFALLRFLNGNSIVPDIISRTRVFHRKCIFPISMYRDNTRYRKQLPSIDRNCFYGKYTYIACTYIHIYVNGSTQRKLILFTGKKENRSIPVCLSLNMMGIYSRVHGPRDVTTLVADGYSTTPR